MLKALLLYPNIPEKINFLQSGRYGNFFELYFKWAAFVHFLRF